MTNVGGGDGSARLMVAKGVVLCETCAPSAFLEYVYQFQCTSAMEFGEIPYSEIGQIPYSEIEHKLKMFQVMAADQTIIKT